MVGLLVIAHAPFAAALFSCAQHVFACPPERCAVLDLLPDADPAIDLVRARDAVAALDGGDGVLVLVDMFGATPGNIATQLSQAGRVEVVAGVNLPMLMRVLCYRTSTTIGDLPEKALGGGASGIMKIASTAPQNQLPLPHSRATAVGPEGTPRDDHPSDDHPTGGTLNDGRSRLQDQQ